MQKRDNRVYYCSIKIRIREKSLHICVVYFLNLFGFSFIQEDTISSNNERLVKLGQILNKDTEIKKENKLSSELNEYLNKINEMVYFVKWNRLTDYHKTVKLKEYIDSLVTSKNKQNKLLDKLLNDKKLSKKVDYDEKKGCINFIEGIVYDEISKSYTLKKI